MSVLVDSSVWIGYFRGRTPDGDRLEALIDEGLILTNNLILAELLPPLRIQRKDKLAALLRNIRTLPLDIDWEAIVDDQVACLKHGINKVGIADLIIAQNAKQHGVPLYSQDKHFVLMARHIGLDMF